MKFNCKEDIIQLTPNWKGERLPDGRPKVSEDVLNRLRKITLEEAWGPLFMKGYRYQWETAEDKGRWRISNWRINAPNPADRKVMVGRAVTCVFQPRRPDLSDYLLKYGHEEEGRSGNFNQWVIDSLGEDDVVVVDLFGKIREGTFIGGNLGNIIQNRTKRGGAVIWGGVRDFEQNVDLEDVAIFHLGEDPTGINEVMMTGFNTPTRIGNAVCMPGDVVLGTLSGVIFIPAHEAEAVAIDAEKSHVRDIFGFQRLAEKVYTAAEIDAKWPLPIWEDFLGWMKTAPEAEEYKHLVWDEELEEAKSYLEKDKNASDVRL